jgi:hypothetical protein
LQYLWLCNNRFLLRCDLLLEGSPPQHFRLFSLFFILCLQYILWASILSFQHLFLFQFFSIYLLEGP